jgi:hypothetical protein
VDKYVGEMDSKEVGCLLSSLYLEIPRPGSEARMASIDDALLPKSNILVVIAILATQVLK